VPLFRDQSTLRAKRTCNDDKDSELANGIKVEYLDSLKFMESEGEKLRDVFTYDCKTAPKQVPVKPADPEIIRVTVERNLKGMIKFEDFFRG
jgi:hypothetical protein